MPALEIPSNRWKRIIPVAFLMYTIAFMDRTNISFGLFGMQEDLGIDDKDAGLAAGVFFFGYLFLQVPGALLAQKWSAKKFILISLLFWSVFSIATGFVQNFTQLLIVRFLLGVAEGGVSPATMILLTKWFPLNERARANAYWYLCIPFASIIVAPLSGFILTHMDWRWMFIIEGIPPLLWALVWWFTIDDEPNQAKWISKQEREYLETTLAAERKVIKKAAPRIKDALTNRNVILLLLVFCFLQVGFYGFGLWLPKLIDSISSGSLMVTSLLSALPWIAAMIGSIINSKRADRTGNYKWTLAVPILAGAGCLLISVLFGRSNPILSILFLCLCLGFMYCYGVFWTAVSAYLADEVLSVGIGTINAIGNLGGFIGPFMVGYLISGTGSFLFGIVFLVSSLTLSGILALFLKERNIAVGAEKVIISS
ncbi:MFS transporter [Fictibacillus terranigra]|uniref:MFS transporter n=1 Tax=Fictibacillus terranigra TaxID=3058424 RepID=A0ABT8EAL9_9BACL|nr:MFS transporter [Fictibacillus sp. CENA-BCM004]MDN4074950.1 MFS transporter [Fictibacillus sp. CENA-BCM004]